jgi:capsular exopolysaccharide synthesis family protein
MTAGFPRLFDLRDATRTAEHAFTASAIDHVEDRRLILHREADSVYVEQYRRLGAALHHAQVQAGIGSVMIAIAIAAEGKTLTATNLALMLSRSFAKRVLLVDADLRKPSIHQLLQIENSVGFSDILAGQSARFTTQALSPTLSVITAGQHHSDPVSLLVSGGVERFLAETREQFDWIVVDTPPVVLFPDAELLAVRLDTCVMVVGAATTASPVAASAVAAIGAARIRGVVLNRAEFNDIAGGYAYGQYGYERRPNESGRVAWRPASEK